MGHCINMASKLEIFLKDVKYGKINSLFSQQHTKEN